MRAARGWAVSRALQRLSSLDAALEGGRRNFFGILGFNGCKALAVGSLGPASRTKGYTDAPEEGRMLLIRQDDAIRRAELHWYEATGIGRYEFKIKRYLD
jgi:hypothetical protein